MKWKEKEAKNIRKNNSSSVGRLRCATCIDFKILFMLSAFEIWYEINNEGFQQCNLSNKKKKWGNARAAALLSRTRRERWGKQISPPSSRVRRICDHGWWWRRVDWELRVEKKETKVCHLHPFECVANSLWKLRLKSDRRVLYHPHSFSVYLCLCECHE